MKTKEEYLVAAQNFVDMLENGQHEIADDYVLTKKDGKITDLVYREVLHYVDFLQEIANMLPKETGIDWEMAIKMAATEPVTDDMFGNSVISVYIGSEILLKPSHKIYAPWTSNQTSWDEFADEIFWELLDEEARKNGFYVEVESGDIFAVKEA